MSRTCRHIPEAAQLRELAAGADTPHSTLASPKTKSLAPPATARFVRCGQPRCSSTATAATDRRGSSPTAAIQSGAGKCGAPSSLCAAATPNNSKRSKTNDGPMNQPSRRSALSPYGGQSSTKHVRIPATSSASRPSSTTTPNSCVKRVAVSPRRGSQARLRQSGQLNSGRAAKTSARYSP
jgi:hypothetical protein